MIKKREKKELHRGLPETGKRMSAKEFYRELSEKIKDRPDVIVERRQLQYRRKAYDFMRIASRDIGADAPVVLLRAGIHGDEIAGPLTFLRHLDEIIGEAHRRGIGLIVYPLGNPSGFEAGLRYNIDNDRGETGNNDFLRYELADGKIVDDLGESDDYKRWYWSSDEKSGVRLPQETALMHGFLREDPLERVAAVIDLHQDYIVPDAAPAAYHYASGDLSVYGPIVEKIEKIVPILRNKSIGAGQASEMKSDDNGFIVRHDGTLPDLLYRLGARHCITVETTGATPIDDACRVNMIWIRGIFDLIAKAK